MKKQSLIITAIFTALFTCAFAVAQENFDKPNFGPKPPSPNGEHFARGLHNEETMRQHMIEFETKLKLTEEQKAQIKKNQEKSRKKLEKIMEQEKKLKEEKFKIMSENKKDFEAILTDEQKETLKQMREEKIKEWKAKHKDLKNKGKVAKPLPVKPKTETK